MGPALAAAMTGGMSLLGGGMANRARSREAATDRSFQSAEALKTRDFQTRQAGTQMAFQERMRSTEWQAAIRDMEAAGINPALAYSQGGASSPGGASGGGATASGSRANQEDIISPAVSSAMQYRRLDEELKNMRAVRLKTQAETKVVQGKPGQVFGPLVGRALEALERLLSNDPGSSARSVGQALKWYAQPGFKAAKWWSRPYRGAREWISERTPRTQARLRNLTRRR